MNDKKSDGKILKLLKENLPLNSRSKAEVFRDRDKKMSDIFLETDLDFEEFESFIENKRNQRKYFRRPVDIMRNWKRDGWLKRYGIPELSEIGEHEVYKLSTEYRLKGWFQEKKKYFVFFFLSGFIFFTILYFEELKQLLLSVV